MNTINFHGEVFATKTGSKTRDYILRLARGGAYYDVGKGAQAVVAV